MFGFRGNTVKVGSDPAEASVIDVFVCVDSCKGRFTHVYAAACEHTCCRFGPQSDQARRAETHEPEPSVGGFSWTSLVARLCIFPTHHRHEERALITSDVVSPRGGACEWCGIRSSIWQDLPLDGAVTITWDEK